MTFFERSSRGPGGGVGCPLPICSLYSIAVLVCLILCLLYMDVYVYGDVYYPMCFIFTMTYVK